MLAWDAGVPNSSDAAFSVLSTVVGRKSSRVEIRSWVCIVQFCLRRNFLHLLEGISCRNSARSGPKPRSCGAVSRIQHDVINFRNKQEAIIDAGCALLFPVRASSDDLVWLQVPSARQHTLTGKNSLKQAYQ